MVQEKTMGRLSKGKEKEAVRQKSKRERRRNDKQVQETLGNIGESECILNSTTAKRKLLPRAPSSIHTLEAYTDYQLY